METVTATIEPHPVANGIIETTVVEQQQAQAQLVINGETHINGAAAEDLLPPPPPIAEPVKLFDMDLEKMHANLYKSKYLTPQEFLDDVGRILHNATSRADEDPDRFYKAQALFTAAEVSLLEFDPTLKLECERMAPRERQRREEYRKAREKEKEKEKAAADEQVHTPPPGARRSARTNGLEPELAITDPVRLERRLKRQRTEGGASGDSGMGSDDENVENRELKRSRISGDEDEHDQLNLLHSPEPRPGSVHFDLAIQEVPPLLFPPTMPNPNNVPVMDGVTDGMIIDQPSPQRQPIGFASLLNPAEDDPFIERPSSSSLPVPPAFLSHRTSRAPTPILRRSKSPMPVPPKTRSPTPLPEFHVNENLVSQLRASLRANTSSLTVEQLEQLRASCLASIWRHRAEWNRDNLLRELQDIISDFIEEVNADADWDMDDR